MNKRIVVYTALFGDYSGLIEQPKFDNVDYICYTDRTDYKSKTWKIIHVEQPIPNDNTRSNRYYKILPHKHLSKAYDVSVYIDGNILILKDFRTLVKEKMQKASMACFDHNQNKADPRDCIYEEYDAIMNIVENNNVLVDDPKVMKAQMDRFRAEGYPEHNGLITAPILIRKHCNENVIELMEAWWHIVKTESKRDQLSFDYARWKLNFTELSLIDGAVRRGNPWFYTISHRDNYKLKVFKVKLKRFFGFE
ncbi:glycosyltransferase domain-containing protein [Winogradskyella forsetii]|uniref:glycosyltransferase domain-containing protein n=1 Tax=Winogradskyella forsetii TaxID=2686077 RepID=UPI0015BC6E07|nr:glycosyltransferase domain-containing protein [Winogradskyella forsetii]